MDMQRILLLLLLAFIGLSIYQAWQEDYGPQPLSTSGQSAPASGAVALPSSTERNQTDSTLSEVPDLGEVVTASDNAAPSISLPSAVDSADRLTVRTDLILAEIDTQGGDLRNLKLLAYPITKDRPEIPFVLLEDSPTRTFILQSGLLGVDAPSFRHTETLQAGVGAIVRHDGDRAVTVTLSQTTEQGLELIKTYRFTRGSYQIQLTQTLRNHSQRPWRGHQYRQWLRTSPSDDEQSAFIYTYNGAAVYSQADHYEKLSFDDLAGEGFKRAITGGWGAFIQHYFVGAIIPGSESSNSFYGDRTRQGRYRLGLISDPVTVNPGEHHQFDTTLYVGPKLHHTLKQAAEGLELSVDYGYLTVIAQPLFWLLDQAYGVLGNWGWAIIFVTLLIKLAFYWLSESSYRSMARMRTLMPRVQAMREKYADDKQRLNQAMMDLYKKEKVNPVGGCLPMLVQIPFFIALYWVLLESAEMRQAPWILWIDDLSVKDPYFILPLIMGVSMFIQQKLNPAPPDPIQAKVMMILPVVFTAFFAFFPSGLVLYWVTNNVLSIAQQYVITKRIENAEARKKR